MANTYGKTGLTGGSTSDLDGLDGANLSDGDRALVITSDPYVYLYRLNATSGAAESSPTIIAPDNNPGQKRWILVDVMGAAGSVYGDGDMSDLVDDATPQLGGDLEYNENNQVFDITLTSSGTAAGDIITVTFGESVVFGDVCYPDATADEWKKALATNAATTVPAAGIALESKTDGQSGKLLLRGTIRDDTIFSGAAAGDTAFLSDGAAGDVLYAAPSNTGDIVQILGFGLAAGYIFFNPDYTYVEIS